VLVFMICDNRGCFCFFVSILICSVSLCDIFVFVFFDYYGLCSIFFVCWVLRCLLEIVFCLDEICRN